jgi:uncharacterized membrane protein
MLWKELLIATFLIPVLDAPWLWYQSGASRSMFTAIQGGSPVVMRLWPAVVVYIALGYLLLQQTSVLGAALHGSAVYAVYDFTNLVVFKNYTLSFAIQDTIWGGVLFAGAFLVLDKIRNYL